MDYLDNPRKVYGRVDIIYSDSQISDDIATATNSKAEISHTEEVFKGYISPTVKACTLDGNAKMDGSFQMMDNSCIVGWWSKSRCNAGGNFVGAKPYLELTFLKRPIITWIILGDNKLNQYPVNFTVDYYDGEVIKKTERIINNTKIEVKLEPKVEDITKIRLTISSWSKPNACVKILKFYDRLFERYEGDAMQMFEVSEEMGSAEGNYNINSDIMTVSLYNLNRKFDKGYLRSLMILDRKLQPSIGIEKNGEIEYTELGTFYSDEWQISEDSQWVKCSAVDKLIRLQNKTYVGFPLTENVSVYEILEDIFIKLGLKPSEYIIANSVKDIIIPKAYLPKCSYWDALQEIANCALCKVFIDRKDKYVVYADSSVGTQNTLKIGGNNVFSSSSNITLTEFANQVEVEYSDVTISNELVETAETEITLEPNETLKMNMDYTSEIASAFVESSNNSVKLTNFASGVNAGEFVAINITSVYQTAKIKITGNAIVINSRTVTAQDELSIKNFGVTEYKHPASELVQSYEHALYIASVLLAKMKAGEGVVTTMWRGSPAIELGAKYEYVDRFGGIKRLTAEYNKFTYDGSLRCETRGRKVEGG
ncbi:MAG: hypothetical protein RR207_05880 [Clostridia bacterium]